MAALAKPTRPLPETTVEVDTDGIGWWAWARSEAGWCFGFASTVHDDWYFAGPEPPAGGPRDSEPDPGWVRDVGTLPPNWE